MRCKLCGKETATRDAVTKVMTALAELMKVGGNIEDPEAVMLMKSKGEYIQQVAKEFTRIANLLSQASFHPQVLNRHK